MLAPLINFEALFALAIDVIVTCAITLIIGAVLRGLHSAFIGLIGGIIVPLGIVGVAIYEAFRPNPHHYIDYPSQIVAILVLLAFASILPSMISSALTILVARHFLAKVA